MVRFAAAALILCVSASAATGDDSLAPLLCSLAIAEPTEEEWRTIGKEAADPTNLHSRGLVAALALRTAWKLAQPHVRNPSDRQDVAQIIALEVLRSLPNYDSTRPLGAWVATIAIRRTISHSRQHHRFERRRVDSEVLFANIEAKVDAALAEDSSPMQWAAAQEFVALVRRDLDAQASRVRRRKETDNAYHLRIARAHLLTEFLGGAGTREIAERWGTSQRKISTLLRTQTTAWVRLAEKQNILGPENKIRYISSLRGMFPDTARSENRAVAAETQAHIRTTYLAPFPLCSDYDFWAELNNLPPLFQDLFRSRMPGMPLVESEEVNSIVEWQVPQLLESIREQIEEGLKTRHILKETTRESAASVFE